MNPYASKRPSRYAVILWRNYRRACVVCGSRRMTRELNPGRIGLYAGRLYLCDKHDHSR